MGINEISQQISNFITKDINCNEDKKEVVTYGIETLILSLLGLITIVLVSLLFNTLIQTIIAALFGGFLRKLSGGAHFNTPLKCIIFGAVSYSIVGLVAQKIVLYNAYNFYMALALLIFCLIVVAILAPVDCSAKPIHSSVFRKKLKIASISFIIVTFIIIIISNNHVLNTSAVLGISFQTLTLLPVFNKKEKEG